MHHQVFVPHQHLVFSIPERCQFILNLCELVIGLIYQQVHLLLFLSLRFVLLSQFVLHWRYLLLSRGFWRHYWPQPHVLWTHAIWHIRVEIMWLLLELVLLHFLLKFLIQIILSHYFRGLWVIKTMLVLGGRNVFKRPRLIYDRVILGWIAPLCQFFQSLTPCALRCIFNTKVRIVWNESLSGFLLMKLQHFLLFLLVAEQICFLKMLAKIFNQSTQLGQVIHLRL